MMRYLPILLSALSVVSAGTTVQQPQGFLFGFSQTSLILPVVYTCPTPLYLSAATSLNYDGPDATGPYSVVFMVHEQIIDDNDNQIDRWYSHTEVVQDMNNPRFLSNPWMNGTQFIACVWASNGVSGGCQDLFTVVPSEDLTETAFANSSSQCRTDAVRDSWATPANQTLQVDMVGNSGTMSPNGWPPSCSDIQFRPKSGTPPYTTVIAPAQHPPINITSDGNADNYMNYTVRLTHGQPFMAAVYDSAGNSWAVGPLHAGASTSLGCLTTLPGQAPPKAGGISPAELGGGIAGSFVAGLAIAGLIFFILDKKRKHRERLAARRETLDLYAEPRPANYENGEPKPHNGMITPFSEHPHSSHLGYAPPINTDVSPSIRGEGSQISPSSMSPRDQYDGGLGMARSTTMLSAHSRNGNTSMGAGMGPQPPRVNSPPLNERTNSSYGETHSQLGDSVHRPQSAQSADAAALASRNLYVVHSDGGQDYHIQLPGGHSGMNVIELPPGYSPGGSGAGSGPQSQPQPQPQNNQDAASSPQPTTSPLPGLTMHRGPNGRPETEKERLIRMSREQGGSPQP